MNRLLGSRRRTSGFEETGGGVGVEGREIAPSGTETGVIRFTFHTPGAVSRKPSDHVELAVPTLYVASDVRNVPLA